jgi:hypothetical protein
VGGGKKVTHSSVSFSFRQKSGYASQSYTYESDKELLAATISKMTHGDSGRISIKGMSVYITDKHTVHIDTTSQVDNAQNGSDLNFILDLYYYE